VAPNNPAPNNNPTALNNNLESSFQDSKKPELARNSEELPEFSLPVLRNRARNRTSFLPKPSNKLVALRPSSEVSLPASVRHYYVRDLKEPSTMRRGV
jgi:hypothetical protein